MTEPTPHIPYWLFQQAMVLAQEFASARDINKVYDLQRRSEEFLETAKEYLQGEDEKYNQAVRAMDALCPRKKS